MDRRDTTRGPRIAGGRSPLLIAAAALLALAACGKKPDFPVAPGGSSTPRLYPDPTLDPGYVPPAQGTARPAPPTTTPLIRPVPLPENVPGTEDAGSPTAPAGSNPGAPATPAIPPGTVSSTPGQ